MQVKHINAVEAKKLVDGGALLVDIREVNEYLGENIPAARNAPLSGIAGTPITGAPAVVFHCKSGAHPHECSRPGSLHRCRGLHPRRRHRGMEGGRVPGEAGIVLFTRPDG
jgi:hypothetical protein